MGTPKIKIRLVISNLEDPESSVICPMVFNIDDMKQLRELGICGILSGTLPTAAQQNMFLSIPLKLMVEETIWLVLNGHAELQLLKGPMGVQMANIMRHKGKELYELTKDRLMKSFDLQRAYKQEQHLLKLQQLGIDPKKTHSSADNTLIESSLFIETTNESSILTYYDESSSPGKQIEPPMHINILNLLISRYTNWNNYLLYQSLKTQNYVMSPGGRFGGLFIAYPGDPLRYHSHLTIDSALDYYNDPIDFISLTSGARIGTAVKKLWVIGGVKHKEGDPDNHTNYRDNDSKASNSLTKQNNVSFFSIEWAGFG